MPISVSIILFLALYMVVLALIAQWAHRHPSSKWIRHPMVYALSIGVYCSAWTFYGSVGAAAEGNLWYVTIYLGPIIVIPTWLFFLKKTITISKLNNVASLADFITLRYGNRKSLGALITLVSLLAIVPYISLQLKAIADSIAVFAEAQHQTFGLFDTSFLVALAIALFTAYFGVKFTDASDKHPGIVITVALESLIKLCCFLIVGGFIAFIFYSEGYNQLPLRNNMGFNQTHNSMNWLLMLLISMGAFTLLPRQFQMQVVENQSANHIKKAMWAVPLYLLLFNLLLYPIASTGNALALGGNPDTYILTIPKETGQLWISLIGFLGGFSAAMSMIMVSVIALSVMATNHLIIPYGFLKKLQEGDQAQNTKTIKSIRRGVIILLVLLAYGTYRFLFKQAPLLSIGLIAFVFITQFAPAFLGGLFWKKSNASGALYGILVGSLICVYTLLIPYFLSPGELESIFSGLLSPLNPTKLAGLSFGLPIANGAFWSLTANVGVFLYFSVVSRPGIRERNQAEVFVDIEKYSAQHEISYVWSGKAYVRDIAQLLDRFIGAETTKKVLQRFNHKYGINAQRREAEPGMIKLAERLLTGTVGPYSAKTLIASVIQEEEINLVQLLQVLEESRSKFADNKVLRKESDELQRLTNELKQANDRLVEKDAEKDEFMDLVSHELKSPMTSIRAAAEILADEKEMEPELRGKFLSNILQETDRVTRLINHMLDLEKIASEKYRLRLSRNLVSQTFEKVGIGMQAVLDKKNISLKIPQTDGVRGIYDQDRIVQVLQNLISNANKFSPNGSTINLLLQNEDDYLTIGVEDFGKGISPEEIDLVFNRFYQAKKNHKEHQQGVGLGLAISQRIVELHQGRIWVESKPKGAIFKFTLPKYKT